MLGDYRGMLGEYQGEMLEDIMGLRGNVREMLGD